MKVGMCMNDYSNANHLPTEIKLLLVNGQTLVNSAKEKIKSREYYFDLTSKMQLKSDYKEVEKYIRHITNGNMDDEVQRKLELAIARLKTTLNGLIEFYSR